MVLTSDLIVFNRALLGREIFCDKKEVLIKC